MGFTSEDTRGVLMASLVPGATMLLRAGTTYDKDLMNYWQSARKPDWAPTDIRFHMTSDALIILPLGCAAYLVYKHGGGFEDQCTKKALAAFGALNAGMCLVVPAVMKRDWSAILGMTVLNAHLAAGTAYLFYKIYPTAGLMVAPLAAYMCMFSVPLMYQMSKLNADDKE